MADWADDAVELVGQTSAYMREQQALATFAAKTIDGQPDLASKANAFARFRQYLPAETIQRNYAYLEKEARGEVEREIIIDNPQMHGWLANPRNAEAAQGDVKALAAVSSLFTPPRAPGSTLGGVRPAWSMDVSWRPRSVDELMSDLQGYGEREDARQRAIQDNRPTSSLGSWWRGLATDVSEGFRQSYYGMAMFMLDAMGAGAPDDENIINPNRDQSWSTFERYRSAYTESKERQLATRPKDLSMTGNAIYGGLSSFAQFLPALAAAPFTDGTSLLALIGTQTGSSAYGKYRERGATRNEALVGGALEGTIEAVTERIPLDFVVGRFGKEGIGSFLGGFLVREMATEQVATFGQDAVDTAIANPNKTWGEFWAERPRAAFDTAVATIIAGGLITTGSTVYRSLHDAKKDVETATTALAGAKFLDAAVDSAVQSQIAMNDPQGFAEFIQQQAEGTPLGSVYVPAEAVRSLFQGEGRDWRKDPFWSKYQDQMDQALPIGGDIVLPIGEAVVGFAQSGKWENIREVARLSPGGMSLAEARSIEENYAQSMEARGREAASTDEALRAEAAPAQRVYDEVFTAARQSGKGVNAARAYADLWSARYAARAAQRGVDAWTLFSQSVGGIVSELPADVRKYRKADQVDRLVNVMRRDRAAPSANKTRGRSLLEWIAGQGGIEDPRGDIASMGGAAWHRGSPGRRKLIKATDQRQGDMIGGESSANSVDDLFARAIEAGYFPQFNFTRSGDFTAADAPDVGAFLDAIGAELRGSPVYSEEAPTDEAAKTDTAMRDDAAQLREYLENRGLDPDTASTEEIRAAMKEGEARRPAAVFFEQLADNPEVSFYQGQPEHPAFYSALRRAVESAKINKAPAAQWKGTLLNTPGVKAEEIEWSGLLEWLDLQGDQPVAKADVQRLLDEGGIHVSEVVLGEADNRAAEREATRLYEDWVLKQTLEVLGERDDSFPGISDEIEEVEDGFRIDGWTYETIEEAEEVYADLLEGAEHEWELQQRESAEREVRSMRDEEDFIDEAKEKLGALTAYADWTSTGQATETYRELLITLPLATGRNPKNAPDTHWEQVGVVAHARFQGKRDPQGRPVLFVEEVQSDWHQKGRDEGYEQAPDPEALKAARDALMKAGGEHMQAMRAIVALADSLGILPPDEAPAPERGFGGFVLRDQPLDEQASYADRALRKRMLMEQQPFEPGEAPVETFDPDTEARALAARSRLRSADLAQREAEQAFARLSRPSGIPNAPFRSSWPTLVMKRVIRWAVDNGYSSVAWTTGAQQAERYSLSQRVGSIQTNHASYLEPGQVLVKFGNRGVTDLLLSNDMADGTSPNNSDVAIMTREQLVAAFGESLGNKVFDAGIATPPFKVANFDAGDLEIGGEGMKAFYDRNLVNMTNDLVKKYGAKVGKVDVLDETQRADQMLLDAAAVRRDADAIASVDGRRAAQLYDDANRAEETAAAMRAAATAQQWGFEITPKLADAAAQGFALFQGGESKPRGRIDFGRDGKAVIRLFEGHDLSTLLHEGAHLFIEELRADALLPDAPQQVRDDWEAVKAWFQANGFDVQEGAPIPTDAHEMWARGMERYFMEGKAPVPALKRAFASFRSWLTRLYQMVANLDTPLTDEVRRVMDRLIATEDAIAGALAEPEAAVLSQEDLGATDAEYAAYREAAVAARSEAVDQLLFKTMEAIRRERTAEWKRQERVVRGEIEDEVKARPEFRALAILRSKDPAVRIQLNRARFVEEYGSDALALFPAGVPPFFTDKGGVTADVLAARSGFISGRALVDMLMGVETRQRELKAAGDKRSVLRETVDIGTAAEMSKRFGDPLADGSIEEEALASVHSELRLEALANEFRLLSRRASREGTPSATGDLVPSPASIARQWAAERVRAGKVADEATAAALLRHQRAEAKASRAVQAAILSGNLREAARQKQSQLYHAALFREAKAAKDEIDKIVRRLGKLAKARTLKSMDQEYLERIHDLLEAYDFRPRSARDRAERVSFLDWVRAREEAGEEVFIPERLKDFRSVNFKDATVEELLGLDDMVQSIAFLGRKKKKLTVGKEERDFEELIANTLARSETQPSRKFSPQLNKPGSLARQVISSGVTVERMADFMDNYDPNGGFNEVLIRGARDSANTYARIGNEVLDPIVRAYMDMPKAQRRRLFERVRVPEFMTIDPDTREIHAVEMLRMDLIAVALNTGTASNLDKMIRGENLQFRQMPEFQINEAKIMQALNRELTAEDWAFVQSLWDNVGKLWPHIERSERAITGMVPEKVEERQVVTKHGVMQGRYWPVVYDPDPQRAKFAGFDATRNADKDAQTMFGQIGRAVGTAKGHTISRTEYAAPVLFSLEAVLFRHVRRVATRAAYGAWVRDALKFANDPRIEEIMSRKLGREYYAQIHPWLRDQINDSALDTADLRGIDKIMRTARTNATAVGLVYRFTTLLTQVFGVANSIAEVGPMHVLDGYGSSVMPGARAEALEKSEELKRRAGEFDRDVAAALQDIASPPRTAFGRRVEPFARFKGKWNGLGFWFIGQVQLQLVDIPLWIGAYKRALGEGMDEDQAINFADKSVRKSQGSGAAKDQAAIQRGREAYRIFTVFYTYWGSVLNYQWEVGQAVRSGNHKRAMNKVFWVMIVGPLLTSLVMDAIDGEDSDEDWWHWAMRNVFFGLWGGVPIVRDFAAKWNREMGGKYTPEPQTPGGRILTGVKRSGADALGGLGQTEMYAEAQAMFPNLPDQKEPSARWLKNAIESAGLVTGLGTGQLAATTQYLVDVAEGDQEPESAADVARGVLKGPRADQ